MNNLTSCFVYPCTGLMAAPMAAPMAAYCGKLLKIRQKTWLLNMRLKLHPNTHTTVLYSTS